MLKKTDGPKHILQVAICKNGTALWREAHLQVKMLKELTVPSTFCKFRSAKTARRCGAKHICKWTMYKKLHGRRHFGSCDPEKWHAAVARSAFARENVKKIYMPGPLLDVRMSKNSRKMLRRCGAKHIWKSECSKHLRFPPLLEVGVCESLH